MNKNEINPEAMHSWSKDEFLWELKYRPQTLKDVILPDEIKNYLIGRMASGEIPNLGLWSRTPGLGKTSLAYAIAGDMESELLFINASEENGINVVRTDIKQFVDSVSFTDNNKICILDEVDQTTSDFQKAFRSFLENASTNARFILTANYKFNIIDAIRNRLYQIDFDDMYVSHKKEMMKKIFNRLKFILDTENIEYDDKDVQFIVKNQYPSTRSMIISMQNSILNGKLIVSEDMVNIHELSAKLTEFIAAKKWDEARDTIAKISNPALYYHYLFRHMKQLMPEESQKHLVIILDDQMYKLAHVRDMEITLTSTVSQIMLNKNIVFYK